MAQITTKFDIGDEVWIMAENKPQKQIVFFISIGVSFESDSHTKVVSQLYSFGTKSPICTQDEVFATKRELLESFLDDDEVVPIESGQK